MSDLQARRAGRRHLTFGNGRSEDYEAVEVWHEPSGAMWDRILIARDDGTLADRIVAALTTPATLGFPGHEADCHCHAAVTRYIALATPPAPTEHEPWCYRRHEGDCVDGPRYMLDEGVMALDENTTPVPPAPTEDATLTLQADDAGYVTLPDGSVFPAGRGHSVTIRPAPTEDRTPRTQWSSTAGTQTFCGSCNHPMHWHECGQGADLTSGPCRCRNDGAAPTEDAGYPPFVRHPITCGVCSWGRSPENHSFDDYNAHMAASHPAPTEHSHIWRDGELLVNGCPLTHPVRWVGEPSATPPAPTEDDLGTPSPITGPVLARAWALSGRSAPLMEPDEWDGFALTIRAIVATPAPTEVVADTPTYGTLDGGQFYQPAPTEDALYDDIRQAAMGGPDFTPLTAPTEDATLDALVATLKRDDLCDETEGEHHTDEYIASFLVAFDVEMQARTAVAANTLARFSAPITESDR